MLRRVVVTGADGTLGRVVVAGLSGRWDLTATDVVGGCDRLDVTDDDACRRAFTGADAVVHLAADPDPTASWERLQGPNVVGCRTVAATAAEVGVRRLVLASSLQAVSGYPADHQVRAGDPARPANLYGATKAWAEALGSWVAATSSTTVVALRIGYFAPERPPVERDPRDRAAWLSPRDCVELVRAAVEGPVEGFALVSGISANAYRKASFGEPERALGYSPVDDAFAG